MVKEIGAHTISNEYEMLEVPSNIPQSDRDFQSNDDAHTGIESAPDVDLHALVSETIERLERLSTPSSPTYK